MPAAEVQKAPATGTQEAEEAVRREVAAVLDFDMLCATVALQTQGMSLGKSRRKEAVTEEGDEDEEMEFGSVQRMWEGDVTDCFDDRRIAIETACPMKSMVIKCATDTNSNIMVVHYDVMNPNLFCSCPCYRFGMNMRRANLGSCFLQVRLPSCFASCSVSSAPK
ncbi:hypothetical protein B296_00041283 [Ensete ventricosum]|uniref:Uncharacterized protein n=1 Tax=Ensete ventricosum TaxID=4639 RepID=A0A426XKT4_ENSVE|nr:hypothetical protein B296_00041283 [Ensete ventricosum]